MSLQQTSLPGVFHSNKTREEEGEAWARSPGEFPPVGSTLSSDRLTVNGHAKSN